MATYLDFLRISNREQKLRRVYWVSGEEVVLREQVVSLLRREAQRLGISIEERQSLSVREDGEATVWDALDAWPFGARAFLVVRDAEQLRHRERIAAWLEDRSGPPRVGVFVSDEYTWPTSLLPEARARVAKSGMLVECSRASERTALEVATGWLGGETNEAERLLRRVGWDLRAARDAASKAQRVGRRGDRRVLEFLTEPHPQQQFAEQLTACDRQGALRSATVLLPEERSAAIGLLDANLAALSKINRALRSAFGPREIAARLDLHRLVVERLAPYARLYDPEAVRHRAVVLADAERAVVEGAEVGVMEVLAATW